MLQSLADATTRVLCSNADNIGERKTWTQSEFCTWINSVTGKEPPKMYIWCTRPGDGQTSCKVRLVSVERRRCSNEAKTRNPLKFACGGRFCRLTVFSIVDACHSGEDIARLSCAMVPRWRICGDFLRPVFSASRVQRVSDLHPKFALRLHHVCKYDRHPICDG